MRICLKTFADFREITGIREKQLDLDEGLTVAGLLQILVHTFPRLQQALFDKSGSLREFIILFVNGRTIDFLDKLDTRLKEGDVVALFPPVAGG